MGRRTVAVRRWPAGAGIAVLQGSFQVSDHSSRAGRGLRFASFCVGLGLLLQALPAAAFQLGGLQVDAAPGSGYSAWLAVALAPGESLDYLVVDAHALVPNAVGGFDKVPLQVELLSTPDTRVELSAPMSLPPQTRVEVDARIGNNDVSRVYDPAPLPVAAVVPPPAPAAIAPPPAPVAQAWSPAPEQAPPPPAAEMPPPYLPPPVAVAPQPAYVPPPSPGSGIYVRPVVDLGYEIGGDRLLEVQCTETYSDGSTDNSTPSLRSGTGLVAGGGAHVRPDRASPYDLRVTIDYKYASVCGSASMQRVRFTFLPSYRFGWRPNSFWAGAGLIYETGIKFNGGGLQYEGYNVPDLQFNDAVGGTVQVGWWFLALDYNFIRYTYNGTSAAEGFHTSANSVGFIFTYGFDFF
jgi:hypothetical protein